ncbi:Xaa-Pro peptidase family protein [Bacillaceae bacterium S4-13-58]
MKISVLQELLDKNGEEAIFLTSRWNIFYISGYDTDPHERVVGIYVPSSIEFKPVMILPSMEVNDARQSGWSHDIIAYQDQSNPWDLFSTYLQENKQIPTQIALEKDHLTVSRQEQLKNFFPNVTWSRGDEYLQNLRVQKDKKEYTLMKQAAALADLGVKIGIESLAKGKTELEIVADIEYGLKKQGIREMSFSTLVLFGENTSSPHGTPGKNTLQDNQFVLFDLGVVFEGYCSDITRTVFYGTPTEEQKKIYEIVKEAQQFAINECKLDTPIGVIDKAARNYIEDAGYGDYFPHRIGHGIGVDVHEYPSIHQDNTLLVKEGMAFTIEPGIYIQGHGGVRIEDQIYMTDKGPEILNQIPKELQLIMPK